MSEPKQTAKKAATGKQPAKKAAPKKKAATKKAASTGAPRGGGKHLVIVESPNKIKSLGQYATPVLGPGVKVMATVGHFRDLPTNKLGVDVEKGFEPTWVFDEKKHKVVDELKAAVAKAETIWLATDLDREGEAISWHVLQATGLSNGTTDPRVRRVTFGEITKDAVREAFAHPREIDTGLVDAYLARRVLDRLAGWDLSRLIWEKVRYGLSGGRVQSPALRLVVDREREIRAFEAVEYWSIEAQLTTEKKEIFQASLFRIAGEKVEIGNEADATRHVEGIRAATDVAVQTVTRKQVRQNPPAPFTTSTMQQQASSKLGFAPSRTMRTAQKLYEGLQLGAAEQIGLITYMRTDSVNLASSAVDEIRGFISERYGANYLPSAPRTFKGKKGAQEAHEAVRPTDVTRTPDQIEQYLNTDQAKLYRLIWERTVACQMSEAIFDQTTADIAAATPSLGDGAISYTLRATGRIMRFDGFRVLSIEQRDDEAEEGERRLPELSDGQPVSLVEVTPNQHFTQPPPRYTEATLVKALEEFGIGRPSTYASVLESLKKDDKYIYIDQRRIHPQDVAFVVVDMLVEHIPRIVDMNFTAHMEEDLDEVAERHKQWRDLLREFYDPFSKLIEKKQQEIRKEDLIKEQTDKVCPICGGPMQVKIGRFGKFLSCANYPECKGTLEISGRARPEPKEAPGEMCHECGAPMMIKSSRYGTFLGCSRYPECKGTRPLPIGGRCPKCKEGRLAERKTKGKGKRSFYGCTRYPDCDYVSWVRPYDEPCPKCGGTMFPDTERGFVCVECGHDVPKKAPEPSDAT